MSLTIWYCILINAILLIKGKLVRNYEEKLMEKIAKQSYKKTIKSAMKVSQHGIYQLKNQML